MRISMNQLLLAPGCRSAWSAGLRCRVRRPCAAPVRATRATSSARRVCSAFSAAISPALTPTSPLAAGAAASADRSGSPHSRCTQRASRAPGAFGSFSTLGGSFSAISSRKPSTEEMSAKRCSRSQFSRNSAEVCGPRSISTVSNAADSGRQVADTRQVVLELHDAAAAAFEHQAQRLQPVHRGQHLGVGGVDDRIARGLLVAARDQRIQRQRVGVGHGVLLFRPARPARALPAASVHACRAAPSGPCSPGGRRRAVLGRHLRRHNRRRPRSPRH